MGGAEGRGCPEPLVATPPAPEDWTLPLAFGFGVVTRAATLDAVLVLLSGPGGQSAPQTLVDTVLWSQKHQK